MSDCHYRNRQRKGVLVRVIAAIALLAALAYAADSKAADEDEGYVYLNLLYVFEQPDVVLTAI